MIHDPAPEEVERWAKWADPDANTVHPDPRCAWCDTPHWTGHVLIAALRASRAEVDGLHHAVRIQNEQIRELEVQVERLRGDLAIADDLIRSYQAEVGFMSSLLGTIPELDEVEHKPGPAQDEPPYSRTCVQCGQSWPCPARKADLLAQAEEMAAANRHQPLRMLDVSEVVPGCWVSWRGSENADFASEPRGGVVISIDHYGDPETGESLRAFNVAKEYRGRVKWDRLTQDQVGTFDLPNPRTIDSLRRAMAREMGSRKGAVMTDERRMAEAIPILMRSVG